MLTSVLMVNLFVVVASKKHGPSSAAAADQDHAFPEFDRKKGHPIPSLMVFDLDGMLWDAEPYSWVEFAKPPFRKKTKRTVLDSAGEEISLHSGALPAMKFCKAQGCKVAVVANSGKPDVVDQFLDLFELTPLISYKLVSPASGGAFGSYEEFTAKMKELMALSSTTERPSDIMLFDDHRVHVGAAKKLGIEAFRIEDGFSIKEFERAMKAYGSASRAHPDKPEL